MKLAQWIALIDLSFGFGWVLDWLRFPAALLLGPLVVAIAFGVSASNLEIPAPGFIAAQALVGMLVASTVTGPTLHEIAAAWVALLFIVVTTVLTSVATGWLLTRARILPGTTAAWGSSPGAAAAMVAMAQDFGADARLVAFMQYLRVLIVVISASLVTRFVLHTTAAAVPSAANVVESPFAIAATLAVAVVGVAIARVTRAPAGALVGPMLLGGGLHAFGIVNFALPEWLLAATYAVLGWYIGLRFTRDALLYAIRILPAMLLATGALIAICALSAVAVSRVFGLDRLTAFLATSPGGLDSIAVIALGSKANLPFVLAAQTLRLFAVILTGPAIARMISRYA